MQAYSDPSRENDPHALPDIEVFYLSRKDCDQMDREELASVREANVYATADDICGMSPGWYWQSCFPGCLPDGEPVGPFETEAEALADAQS